MLVSPVSPSLMLGYQVEDYSLTLLRHKSYFNNRSLARCLDEEPDEDTGTKVQLINSKESGDNGRNESVAGRKENDPEEHDRGGKGRRIIHTSQRDYPFPKQEEQDNQQEPIQSRSQRSAAQGHLEASSFWSHVRAKLRIDEEEIYETGPERTRRQESETRIEDERKSQALDPSSTPDVSPPASWQSNSKIEHPLLHPQTRPPPQVPAAALEQSLSAVSRWKLDAATHVQELFPDLGGNYPIVWDEPPLILSRESSSVPKSSDIANLSFDAYPEPELPRSVRESGHSRYPSSGSSPWMRPPTWRLPSSLYPSTPPLPPQLPLPAQPTSRSRHPANHRRNRHGHQPHPSKISACTSSSSSSSSFSTTHSITASDSSGCRTNTCSSRQTAQTVLSSPCSSLVYGPDPPLRGLTTEEKLSEIDAFLEQDADPGPEREWECHDQDGNQTDGGWI
ncbi:hypothetical protein VTH06DRAFT_2307 [Thermothelomyces fergusii]